jgi:NADH-quinone oxidoreductase subunit N
MVSFGKAMFFLGLEVLSIALYVLASSNRASIKSNEAGLKYFDGIICIRYYFIWNLLDLRSYGSFDVVTLAIYHALLSCQFGFHCIALLTIGMLFKIAAVPFHFWAQMFMKVHQL